MPTHEPRKRNLSHVLVVLAALSLIALAIVLVLAHLGAFSSERELGASDIEEILETGYSRDFTFVSEQDDVTVTGSSPKLDANTSAFEYSEHFEHVYTFKDGEGLSCTVYQSYKSEETGSLKKVNQVRDDYYWQELKPRLEKLIAKHSKDWPGTWKVVDMPLHPRIEASIGSYAALEKIDGALAKLRTAVKGLSQPRENADAFRREGSPYEGFEHVPDPLMPRVDILAANATDGEPFLLYWYTPFGSESDYKSETGKEALEQLRAVYVRGVKAGTIDERLSSKAIVRHLSNHFTKTQFYYGGSGPASSNDILWTYSSESGELTVSSVELKHLVEGLNGYYCTTQDTKSERSEWSVGDDYWSATPDEGADRSFDEGTIDLSQVTFTRNDSKLTVYTPTTGEDMKRSYTASQLEMLLNVKITVDLDSGTVKVTRNGVDTSVGVGSG